MARWLTPAALVDDLDPLDIPLDVDHAGSALALRPQTVQLVQQELRQPIQHCTARALRFRVVCLQYLCDLMLQLLALLLSDLLTLQQCQTRQLQLQLRVKVVVQLDESYVRN